MNQHNETIKNKSKSTWGTNPAGWTFGQGHEKGSKEFFDAVVQKRFSYECDWFDEVVNFSRFKDKKVLEVGSGAGYDAYMFCKHGADYTGIDLTPDNKIAATKHLGYYGFKPTIECMDVEKMSFKNKFDYVFSFGVLHHTPDIEKSLKNIYRALKKGGEAQIIVYNKHSLFYWLTVILNQWILRGGFLKRSLAEQRSLIEYTESTELPLVNVYSKKEIKNFMKKTGFTIKETHIRKLVAQDLPIIGRISGAKFQKLLSFIGKKFGWYISVKAIK